MIEMNILEKTKETENKVRWDTYIEGTKFSLYIPKWRVPEPVPVKIIVDLFFSPLPEQKNIIVPKIAVSNPNLCRLPIISHLKQHSYHTETIRYDPIGDSDIWEIGSPYIPCSLLPNSDVETILICVQWV